MIQHAPKWKQQCDAARGNRDNFGTEKALGYLVGEKLLTFLQVSECDPALGSDLPQFVAEIKTIFQPWELREYLLGVRRLGPLAHITSEEEFEMLREVGAIEEDVVSAAQDVFRLERIKDLLLDGR